jgi:hypothetical protein
MRLDDGGRSDEFQQPSHSSPRHCRWSNDLDESAHLIRLDPGPQPIEYQLGWDSNVAGFRVAASCAGPWVPCEPRIIMLPSRV